jgi:hypothetical protein
MDPTGSQTLGWAKWRAWSRLGVDWYGLYVRKGKHHRYAGKNRLEIRIRNHAGVFGPRSQIEADYIP